MTTSLFTIAISACYRGTREIYSAQVMACNGEQLYHLAEAASISEALEKVVQEMRLQEKDSSSFV
jgi:CRISPR/Cas system-associated exonuclease Cas4 (RecB family)